MTKTLIVILGPTASGKTSISIAIAKYFNTEIISADSRQFYKEIPIGTAAPVHEQLASVKHHFIGNLSIKDNYNVSGFEQDVLKLLHEKFQKHDVMIMTGGSGLYLDAVCRGIDILPDPDKELRHQLNDLYASKGLPGLQDKLKNCDPEYFEIVDLNNSKRLIRAIEVCMQTGKTYTELRKNNPRKRDFNIIKIGLELPRDQLIERIHQRNNEMITNGLIEEAKQVYQCKNLNALNTVGYKELFKYFDGEYSLEEAIEKIKTNTRRFAKRQMTWFRKDQEINWFSPDQEKAILTFIKKGL